MKSQSGCMVCFNNPLKPLPYQEIIHCTKCKASAHKYCYSPNALNRQFICDGCLDGSFRNCYLCQNPGLLKKIGKDLAHPVCLLFNSGIMVQDFGNLTFIQIDNVKFGKKALCLLCGRSTTNLMRCPLNCPKQCHLYCALKSYRPSEEKEWYSAISLSLPPNNFFQLFQNMVYRAIRSSNKFLSKYLNINKSLKALSHPIIVYCDDHSQTIVQCGCRGFSEPGIQMVFCESCCRWQHIDCVKRHKQAPQQISAKSPLFYCQQCTAWKENINSGNMQVLNSYPKLHIYDFIYIHRYLETLKYQVPPTLLEFMFTLPVLPGKSYAESEYRQYLAKKIKPKLKMPALKNGLQKNLQKIDKVENVLLAHKNQVQLAWWIVKGQVVPVQGNKPAKAQQCFTNFIDTALDTSTIDHMIDILIEFQAKYIGIGKSRVLSKVKDKIAQLLQKQHQKSPLPLQPYEGILLKQQKQTRSKSKSPSKMEKKPKPKGSEKKQKSLENICLSLKSIVDKCSITLNNSNLTETLQEIQKIVHQPALLEYHDQLPKIALVKSVLLFQSPKSSAEYLTGCAQMQIISKHWQKYRHNLSNQNSFERVDNLQSLLSMRDIFYKDRLDVGQSSILTLQLQRQWLFLQICNKVPNSRAICCPQEQIPLVLNLSQISKHYLDKLTSYYNRKLLLNSSPSLRRQQQTILFISVILTELQKVKFQEKTYEKMKSRLDKLKQNIEEKSQNQIPIKLVQQYLLLYRQTQKVLTQKSKFINNSTLGSIGQGQGDCLFTRFSRQKFPINSHNHQEILNRLVNYFISIMDLRIDLFSLLVHDVLKKKFIYLLDMLSKRKVFFETEEEYNAVRKWSKVFEMDIKSISNVIQKDDQTQAQLLFIRADFDNPQTIQKLRKILQQAYTSYSSLSLQFRIKKIKVILTWISLYQMVLQQMSPKYLLEPEFASLLQQNNNKIDFYVMKQVWMVMNELKFPPCKFYHKLGDYVQKGQQISNKLDKISLMCQWSFEWQQTQLIPQNKIQYQQCKQIYHQLTTQPFLFQVEIIELEIVMKKYSEVQNNAYLIIIEIRKKSSHHEGDYIVHRIKELLTILGSLPIRSKFTHDLLLALSQIDKHFTYNKSVQQLINEIDGTYKLFTYHEVIRLWERIQGETISSYEKEQLKLKIKVHIQPMQAFMENYKDLLRQYQKQTTVFTPQDLQKTQKMVESYKCLSLEHEDFKRIVLRMDSYLFLLESQKWMKLDKIRDPIKVIDILRILNALPPAFLTNSIVQYRLQLQNLLRELNTRPVVHIPNSFSPKRGVK